MEIFKEGDKLVVKLGAGEVSFVPAAGQGVIGIKFSQAIGDFLRNLPPDEKEQMQNAIGSAFISAIEQATSRLVRQDEGFSARIPGLKVTPS